MFRFNQKKANREADEVKKLLSIMKGIKRDNTPKPSYLKEATDASAKPPVEAPIGNAPIDNNMPSDEIKNPEESTATQKIEDVISGSDNIEKTPEYVKGKIYSETEFQFKKDAKSPEIKMSDFVELDEDLLESLGQLDTVFKDWKQGKYDG